MGLFDFARNIGEKLFSSDDDAPEKIRERLDSPNPGVNISDIKYDDGTVTMAGTAANNTAKEKAVLIAGNVKGVETVVADDVLVRNADGTPVAAEEETAVEVEYYEIQSGDTLSGIAKKLLGNAMDYPKIFEANREVIKDPDLIYPGQKIRIPKG